MKWSQSELSETKGCIRLGGCGDGGVIQAAAAADPARFIREDI